MSYHIYLAGPITGCTYEECVNWREDFLKMMPKSIKCLSPMRGEVQKDTDASIMARDFFDCMRSDVIVFNFLGATRVSIGTVMEAAWGFMKQVLMVFSIEPKGNLHEHGMLRRCMGWRCETIEEGRQAVLAILDVENVGHELERMKNIFKGGRLGE